VKAGASAMKEIQIHRNKFQTLRNEIQAERNKIQIRRNEIQIQISHFPSPNPAFSMTYADNDGIDCEVAAKPGAVTASGAKRSRRTRHPTFSWIATPLRGSR
jgi:hypothetical protein